MALPAPGWQSTPFCGTDHKDALMDQLLALGYVTFPPSHVRSHSPVAMAAIAYRAKAALGKHRASLQSSENDVGSQHCGTRQPSAEQALGGKDSSTE